MKKPSITLLMALCASALCLRAEAEMETNQTSLNFGLYFSQTHSTFDYRDNNSADTTIERLTAALYQPVTPRMEFGMFAGYSLLTQEDRALTAGTDARGYHGGVGIRTKLLDADYLRMVLDLRYAYERVESKTTDQSVISSWTEPQAQLAVVVPVGAVAIYGGVRISEIRGQERAQGTIDSTTDFDSGTESRGFAGAELHLPDGGSIGVTGTTGPSTSVTLYFAKHYN